jgi:hypothetical protein
VIGGTDIIIPSTGDAAALDICARIMRHYWVSARFEDAVTGDKYAQYAEIPFGSIGELLVYRDPESERAWDSDDANTLANSMLYFIRSRNAMTVVVDDPDTAEMRSIVASLRAELQAATVAEST